MSSPELLVAEGTTVDVGTPIITVDTGEGGTPSAAASPAVSAGAPAVSAAAPADTDASTTSGDEDAVAPAVSAVAPAVSAGAPAADASTTSGDEGGVEPGLIGGPAPGGRTSVLVGYGPRTTSAKRRPRKDTGSGATPTGVSAAAAQQAVQTSMMTSPVPPRSPPSRHAEPAVPAVTARGAGTGDVKVLAKPPVRKLAKDLGVDLSTLEPSGPRGSSRATTWRRPRTVRRAASRQISSA